MLQIQNNLILGFLVLATVVQVQVVGNCMILGRLDPWAVTDYFCGNAFRKPRALRSLSL